MTRPFIDFPSDFIFGTATAAYQIEGAVKEDGRGESIWDRFSHTPGCVFEGDTGDVACDHYHRYEDDIQLMADLGIPAYRLSISWPRIFPERGVYNQAGIDFYRRVLETLHKHGVQPAVTLYHWDLPQYLQDEGGWANRATVDYFVEYAKKVFDELGDLVPKFITHNEPWCASFLSYGLGHHAPGHRDWREAYAAAHHILLSHGKAVEAYRGGGYQGEIGITLNFTWADPASDKPEDIAAAKREDGFANRWFIEPISKGHYPQDMVEWVEGQLGVFDFIQPGDFEMISTPIDFLGINFYSRNVFRAGTANAHLQSEVVPPPANRVTDMGWEIHPESLYRLLTWLRRDYTGDLPLVITENGAAFQDELVEGAIHDEPRIHYVADHLEAAKRFIDEGGPLKGYFLWSFMDNFEWAFGYSKRFGMVYVDYDTQVRTVKDSGKWYSGQIAHHRALSV
ncbi:GH1 family beta-glucosidase [Alicyclobacillus acidoterrestris]|uniref:Beta-glucosidase n=1 Tax=Alicyclobacillus acidoterrestris (strain ATCC 49025 / DSM 3922 / CIP 106132 / NCIMB 13137 / GD3B) TaxID=1356854 RepID=T0BPF3_ALIAG|nr:GH1 family beta-glucosidase [Alicyclobacillus acidoterrestris]EPZ42624.1 hypothetical protein N007_14705 [Alicyclobacillus acidoterrestris ATCC 49025]UNO48844.1 GH1 family beta-glucosidase [Alicyclobacillus acidoterrestris]